LEGATATQTGNWQLKTGNC